MAQAYIGNVVPAPGFYKGDEWDPDELLASTARFTQKGATLAPGQGVISLGTVMGQRTSDKYWVPYVDGALDGSEVARGVLRQGVDTGTSTDARVYMGNIVISGILKLDRVKGLDAAAQTDLNARTDDVLNVMVI